MAKIIGEPLRPYVQKQITQRQLAHGSGTDGVPRTLDQISYLNSKTAWVKLASSVRVEKNRLISEELRSSDSTFEFESLAKHHVLFGGISELTQNGDPVLKPRGTYNGSDISNIWNNQWGTYNVNAGVNTESKFGLAPMPGITSVDVKCLNRGSIKKATVNLKCYTPEQFQIIDLLYLRIGYTMFLEWGNSIYLNDNGEITPMRYTLVESEKYGFFTATAKKYSYLGFLPFIEGFRKMNKGNYDGLLCKVVNFNWTFSQDGSYDITLELISLGDVVESLKLNLTPSYNVSNFINQTYSLYKDDADQEISIPPSPADNWISAYLFLQKIYVDKDNNSQTGYTASERQDGDANRRQNGNVVAGIIGDGTFLDLGGVFVLPPTGSITIDNGIITEKSFETKEEALEWLSKQNINPTPTSVSYDVLPLSNTNSYSLDLVLSDINNGYFNDYVITLKTFPALNALETEQEKKDVVYFSYNWGEDDEEQIIEDKGFYMRFGHLLSFLNEYIIPVVKESSPIVKIDYNMWLTKMYTLPFQVSLDPRVCIVNASSEPVNTKKFFPNLINWKYISDDLMTAYGLTMNIYINHSQILSSLEDAKNDKGDVNLFDFLSSLCTALNKAMGGINNLEPIYDEDTHTIYIIDGSYSPKNESRYEIDLYGYDPGKKSSNFIRNFNLKTEITNEFATMATIGSTAGGYTKGVENTMFSKWNKGLQDPWKEKITPPKKAIATRGDDKEITQIYYEDFWMARYSAWGYTLKDVANDLFTSDKASLNDELIEKNLTLVTEFYKYCQSVIQSKQAEYSSPTNGFVPISLGLTMDGISGIKIYNEINVNTKFLPKNYSDSLRFIVKGVNHKLSDSDWETNIETVVISNSGDINQPSLPYWRIRQIIKEAILEGKTESQEGDLPKASAPVREGSGAATRAANKSLKEVLKGAGYKENTFAYELALVIGTKEGYQKGSKNRPSRNNNPGNLVGSGFKDIDPGVTLEPTGGDGRRVFAKFTTPELGSKALIEKKIKLWARGNYPGTVVNSSSQQGKDYRKKWKVPSSLDGIANKNVQLTIEQFFYIYAPPNENNTEKYINSVISSLNRNGYPSVTRYSKIVDWINK